MRNKKGSALVPEEMGHLNLGGEEEAREVGEKSGVFSQKLRIKEQTILLHVNERSKTLESEGFPLAFSNLAVLRKCIFAGEMGSKVRL